MYLFNIYTYAHILWLLALCFYGIPVCMNVCAPASICVSCVFFLARFLLFVLSCSDLFAFILFYFLIILQMPIFSIRRQRKVGDLDGREGGENLGGVVGGKL